MIRKIVLFLLIFIVCSFASIPLSVSVYTTTIQPSSQDTLMDSYRHDSNFGDSTTLRIDSRAVEIYRSLVQFDLSSIPPGSIISSATLKLYYYSYAVNDPVGRTYWAYRVTQSWTEMGATWDTYDGANPWVTAGGDFTTVHGAYAIVPSSYGWMTWTVTDIVKAWVEDGEPNYGFLIKDEAETSDTSYQAIFRSRESGETELRPILEVTYLPPTVGGVIMPVDKLVMLAPYITMLIAAAAVGLTLAFKKH